MNPFSSTIPEPPAAPPIAVFVGVTPMPAAAVVVIGSAAVVDPAAVPFGVIAIAGEKESAKQATATVKSRAPLCMMIAVPYGANLT